MDFSTVKIHCSSLGCLFIEPRDKKAKEAGELSETAKKALIKVYIQEYWGRRRDLTTKEIKKGNFQEPESIKLISYLDDKHYEKNDEVRENDWIIGTPDVVDDDIHDVKSSYDAESFMPMLIEPLEKLYEYQMQGYMVLFNKQKAHVRRCLVSTPEEIVNQEKQWLFNRMQVATEENPEYKIAAANLEYNLIFDDIPPEERCITHTVTRNEEIIAQIPSKVQKAREFLQFLHEKHLSLNKKLTNLAI